VIKLTERQVREIRRLHSEEKISQIRLSERFGVSNGQINKIVKRTRWRHVK